MARKSVFDLLRNWRSAAQTQTSTPPTPEGELLMAIATDLQVQQFVDQRTRPHSELARQLMTLFQDDVASFDDIYQALTQPNPTWVDSRTDGPPHLMLATDVLAVNSFAVDIKAAILNHPQYPIVQKACVRSVLG